MAPFIRKLHVTCTIIGVLKFKIALIRYMYIYIFILISSVRRLIKTNDVDNRVKEYLKVFKSKKTIVFDLSMLFLLNFVS